MYAIGQGALAIECREDDIPTIELLSKISDEETTLCCIAERAFMRALEGGCSVPIGVNSKMENNEVRTFVLMRLSYFLLHLVIVLVI